MACVHAFLGQPDEAFTCLEMSIRNGFGHREWLENDSDLDSLRGDPRFKALLSKI